MDVNKRYPEHAKLKKVQDKSQEIGEFLDFTLPRLGIELMERVDIEGDPFRGTQMMHCRKSIPELLAAHFDIDQKKIDEEKEVMLEELRA